MNKLIRYSTGIMILLSLMSIHTMAQEGPKSAMPCEDESKRRELDFWIGDWDVFDAKNQKVGTNIIYKIQNGCAIQENWKSARGSTGMSVNYHEPSSGKWEQIWVDASGSIIRLQGEFKDGAMRFTKGENISKDGSKELSRMTLTPTEDGKVIQLIEQSKDEGKTWYVWFKGSYVQKMEE